MWNHTSKHTAMISSEIYVFFSLAKRNCAKIHSGTKTELAHAYINAAKHTFVNKCVRVTPEK